MTSGMHHRTDCIRCGERIYHPPLDSVAATAMTPSRRELDFWGHRSQGKVWKLEGYGSLVTHYILQAEDSGFTIATCRAYYALHEEFELLHKIILGTGHKASNEPPF